MKLTDKIYVENVYSGSNWDFEKTSKYIFEIEDRKIEAGYFEHYKENTLIKNVIELSQSYGCPSKCRFCASAGIADFWPLDAAALEQIFCCLYEKHHLSAQKYVLFLKKLTAYDNVHVTISSCLWNRELLKRVQAASGENKIRNIQITYVSDNKDIASSVIPYYCGREYDWEGLLDLIADSTKDYYRINYIMMKGINDSEESFFRFAEKMKRVRDKVIVRISKLNETKSTKINQLYPTDICVLEHLQGILEEKGIRSYVFYSHKNDNMNCGQLITEN